ncbi:MAG: alpha/beta hydrolase fold domain-containing protein [Prevotella sp.]|nr:alpha/beta hydrolase fold domain-containing protein [Prevotella sp.]
MKKRLIIMMLAGLALQSVVAQTARKITVNLTDDGKANIVGYLPVQPTGKAVVGCPGGGYSGLSLQNEGHDWADYFNRQGIAYFVLSYRMPHGDRTIPVGDAQKSIRVVRDSADVWGINPYDVGIMGFSAGGHLASTISTHSEFAERPDFSILFYPVISMNEKETHKGSCVNFLGSEGQKDQQLVKLFSNQHAVRRHLTPPAIILTANDDRTVPPVTNGVAYYTAMRKQGNDCALYIYPTGGHGFGFKSTFTYHDQMLNDLTTWLQRHQGPKKNAVRVACIGNSITDGFGIDMATQQGYPARLQRLLGNGYHVKNFGVSGRTMLNKGDLPYQNELAWRDALAFRPDIVIIKLGTNDSKPENWQYNKGFTDDLQLMVDALKANKNNPRIILCTPIPAFKPTWNINDSVIVNGITPIINKVAKKNKLQVIDLHTLYAHDGDKMLNDAIHPDAKGALRMAEIIAKALKETE